MNWKHHVENFGQKGAGPAITARVARLLLLAFIMTFLMARIVVFLIAEQYIPNLFLFVKGVHVHHLNYGIYTLSLVGLLLLLFRPTGKGLYLATIGYGLGLALTFDEFGMWLFLGGSYNNHLTFDAVVIIASLLALIVLATTVEEFHPRHWILVSVVALLVVLLIALTLVAYRRDLMENAFSIQGL